MVTRIPSSDKGYLAVSGGECQEKGLHTRVFSKEVQFWAELRGDIFIDKPDVSRYARKVNVFTFVLTQ